MSGNTVPLSSSRLSKVLSISTASLGWLSTTAMCGGVAPSPPTASGQAPWRMSSLAASSFPSLAATCRGVISHRPGRQGQREEGRESTSGSGGC